MKKLVWNLEKDTCTPVNNIKEIKIENCESWAAHRNGELKKYCVKVYYTICTGCNFIAYTSNTKKSCIDFIENIFE